VTEQTAAPNPVSTSFVGPDVAFSSGVFVPQYVPAFNPEAHEFRPQDDYSPGRYWLRTLNGDSDSENDDDVDAHHGDLLGQVGRPPVSRRRRGTPLPSRHPSFEHDPDGEYRPHHTGRDDSDHGDQVDRDDRDHDSDQVGRDDRIDSDLVGRDNSDHVGRYDSDHGDHVGRNDSDHDNHVGLDDPDRGDRLDSDRDGRYNSDQVGRNDGDQDCSYVGVHGDQDDSGHDSLDDNAQVGRDDSDQAGWDDSDHAGGDHQGAQVDGANHDDQASLASVGQPGSLAWHGLGATALGYDSSAPLRLRVVHINNTGETTDDIYVDRRETFDELFRDLCDVHGLSNDFHDVAIYFFKDDGDRYVIDPSDTPDGLGLRPGQRVCLSLVSEEGEIL